MQLRNKISECRKRLRQLKGKDYKQVKEKLKLEIENCKMMIKFNEATIKELRERLRL
jgi:mRNA-degrading endonuclease RelE of RelBE toxin-antitoxin system